MRKDQKKKKYEYQIVESGIYSSKVMANNIHYYCQERGYTRAKLSELSGVSVETINSFMYHETREIKMSSAFMIANALDVTMEELTGMPYTDEETSEIVRLARQLPENLRYYTKWSMKSIGQMYQKAKIRTKAIPIKDIVCENGYHTIGHEADLLDISNYPAEIRAKAFMCLKPTCDCFMPYASPYNLLIIANDRPPLYNEIVACISSGKFWLIRKKGDAYQWLRENHFATDHKDIDVIIGYVCHTTKKGEDGF